jgi:hypothetical protein
VKTREQRNLDRRIRRAANEVTAWMKTPEGIAQMIETKRRVAETVALFEKARHITWEQLNEPFTI